MSTLNCQNPTLRNALETKKNLTIELSPAEKPGKGATPPLFGRGALARSSLGSIGAGPHPGVASSLSADPAACTGTASSNVKSGTVISDLTAEEKAEVAFKVKRQKKKKKQVADEPTKEIKPTVTPVTPVAAESKRKKKKSKQAKHEAKASGRVPMATKAFVADASKSEGVKMLPNQGKPSPRLSNLSSPMHDPLSTGLLPPLKRKALEEAKQKVKGLAVLSPALAAQAVPVGTSRRKRRKSGGTACLQHTDSDSVITIKPPLVVSTKAPAEGTVLSVLMSPSSKK
jgi:hypothetical protein